MEAWQFIGILVIIVSIQFFGAAYGDYKSEGKWPWTAKKKGVNSGAKFG